MAPRSCPTSTLPQPIRATPEPAQLPGHPDLTVTCVKHPLWSDVFDHVYRHAADHRDPMEVVVERHEHEDEVRLHVLVPEGRTVIARHADVFVAVDRAFRDLLALPQTA